MHKAYKAGDVLDGVRMKEFRLRSRKRIDLLIWRINYFRIKTQYSKSDKDGKKTARNVQARSGEHI